MLLVCGGPILVEGIVKKKFFSYEFFAVAYVSVMLLSCGIIGQMLG
jgi:hypothetical protein